VSTQEKKLMLSAVRKDSSIFSATLYIREYKSLLQALKPWQKSGILQIQSENRYVSTYMAEIGMKSQ